MSKFNDPAWVGPATTGRSLWYPSHTYHFGYPTTIVVKRVSNGWIVTKDGQDFVFLKIEDAIPLIKDEK